MRPITPATARWPTTRWFPTDHLTVVAGPRSGHPDQMAVGLEKAQELVGIAFGEKAHRIACRRVRLVDALERLHVAHTLERMDHRAHRALPLDRLWRQIGPLGRHGIRVGIGEEIGKHHHEVEQHDHHARNERQPVAPELPPGELPLRGNRVALFGRATGSFSDLGHHCAPWRMRGSIHISSRSDRTVPITVSTLVSACESDCCIIWVMLSMSFVTREITSPRCTRSK